MDKPKLSSGFTMSDIRALRDYNSLRHKNMTAKQISDESRPAVEECIAYMAKLQHKTNVDNAAAHNAANAQGIKNNDALIQGN